MGEKGPVNVEITDEKLVALSLQNKDFFGYIIERYQEKLRRYIRRITSVSEEDVVDILQDVFVKTYINLRGFDSGLRFSTWIYRIAYNETVSRYRKYSRRPEGNRYELEDGDLNEFGDSFSLEESLDTKIDALLLQQALATIDHKYRQVLVLKFLEGHSYEEIGDIIKKPPGTIATLIHRAKKKLKLALEEHNPNHHEQ